MIFPLKNSINTIVIPPQNINSKRTLFLLDTECKGNTQGLVEIFFNKLRRKKTFDNFQEMIPSNFKKLWTDGIENEDYYLKLCGSGGGGFLIGFTRDIDTIDQYFPKKNFEVLLRF